MAKDKNSKFYKDLENEINAQRAIIRNKYKDYDGRVIHATYDYGFLDGTLAGLKVARSLWYKNNPDFDKKGDET